MICHFHTGIPKIDPHTLEIGRQRRLAGTIGRRLRESAISRETRNCDEPAAGLVWTISGATAATELTAPNTFMSITSATWSGCNCNGMFRGADTGICDQHVDWPKLLAEAIRRRPNRCGMTNISSRSERFYVKRFDFVNEFLK